MRLAAAFVGVVMSTTAILSMLWAYSVGSFGANSTTGELGTGLTDPLYVVLISALFQLVAAGLARDLPWGAFALSILAIVGYFLASIDGPEIFIVWAVSAVLMAGLLFLHTLFEILASQKDQTPERFGPSLLWSEENEAEKGTDGTAGDGEDGESHGYDTERTRH